VISTNTAAARTLLDDLVAAGRDHATVDETATILRGDRRTVIARIRDGRIPAADLGSTRGAYRVPVRWLIEQASA
jgi:hypothetical protein